MDTYKETASTYVAIRMEMEGEEDPAAAAVRRVAVDAVVQTRRYSSITEGGRLR